MTGSAGRSESPHNEALDAGERDTFETTRQELQTTFEYQVQRLREIDTKAIEILKANLLLVGLVVTGGSILVQTDFPIAVVFNTFVLTGVALLLLSTALAGITYTSSNLRGGLDAAAIEGAIAARNGEEAVEAYENRLLRSYGRWIEYNARITAVNDMFATITVLLVILALVYIASGIIVGMVGLGQVGTAIAFLGQTVLLLWLSKIVYQMDHLGPVSPEMEETYEGVMLSKGATRQDGMAALKEMLTRPPREED